MTMNRIQIHPVYRWPAFSTSAVPKRRALARCVELVGRTNVKDLKPVDVVARYKSLADIERGFCILKSEIDIGPVFHRLPTRIRAHASLCFMALILPGDAPGPLGEPQ